MLLRLLSRQSVKVENLKRKQYNRKIKKKKSFLFIIKQANAKYYRFSRSDDCSKSLNSHFHVSLYHFQTNRIGKKSIRMLWKRTLLPCDR